MIWVYIVLYLMIGWFIEVTFDEEGAAQGFPFMLTLLWPIAIGQPYARVSEAACVLAKMGRVKREN